MKLDHVYLLPDQTTDLVDSSIWFFPLYPCFRLAPQKHSYAVLFCLPIDPVSIYVSDICTLQRDYVVALVQLCAFELARELAREPRIPMKDKSVDVWRRILPSPESLFSKEARNSPV